MSFMHFPGASRSAWHCLPWPRKMSTSCISIRHWNSSTSIWRAPPLALLAAPMSQIAKKRFIVDNHLSQGEIGLFDDALNFPLNRKESDRWSKAIDPVGRGSTYCCNEGGDHLG